MRHYRVTEFFREELNRYLGMDYLDEGDVGRELYHLENYSHLASVSPEKARLLMATLFPEEIGERRYISEHKKEIAELAQKLRLKKAESRPSWMRAFMIRKEELPEEFEGMREEDVLKGNVIRFM